MLDLPAKTVYADPDVHTRPHCAERLGRMLPHIACNDIRALDDAALEAVFEIGKKRHGKDGFGDDAVLVFTTFDDRRGDWYYHWRDESAAHQGVCQPALELNIVDGCAFRCAYCGFGRYIVFYLDVERFMDGLAGIFARYPNQRLYKYSNMSDLLAFEPELCAVQPMVELFTGQSDRYLMLFTKSDNVGFLEHLDHRAHTIISWSLTSDTVSRLIDERAATLDERIEAMRRAQAAGYIVRARLGPIVPVREWRREYADLIELLFARTSPDLVTVELLGWMSFPDLVQVIDRDLVDPAYLAGAQAEAEELREITWGPFTQAQHEEVYRFCLEVVKRLSPRTPVAVCHGSAETWHLLGDLMGMTPENYVCNCGPASAPGGALYEELHRHRGRIAALGRPGPDLLETGWLP